MVRISRSLEGKTLSHAYCRYCDQENVEVSDIGWLEPTPGDTYDLCPGSPYGDHEPVRARGETSRRCGPQEPRHPGTPARRPTPQRRRTHGKRPDRAVVAWGTGEQEFLANVDAQSAEQFRALLRQILDTRAAHVRS